MALQKTITLASGLVIADAYHRIYDISFSHLDIIYIRFKIAIFVSEQTRIDNKPAIMQIEDVVSHNVVNDFFSFTIMDQVNSNILKKCYDYLKTQTNVEGIDYTTGVIDV